MPQLSTCVINHCDLDAVGCKIALDYLGFKYDKMFSVNYGEVTKDTSWIYNFDKIVCTDFSLSTDLVNELLSRGKIVEIYDHHDYENNDETKGLFSINNKNFKLVHSTEKCGTAIVAEFFGKNIRIKPIFTQFVNIVDTYDLYKKSSPLWPDAENCNRVLWGCINWGAKEAIDKFSFICDYWTTKISYNTAWFWSDFEKQKIEKAIDIENKAYEQALLTYKTFVDSKGIKYGVAVAEKKISTSASRLLKEHEDITYLIMFNTFTKTFGRLSLRSRTNFDCTQFEECQGHKEASGGEVSPQEAMQLYKGKKQLTYKNILEV
jgi:hypothetical protein